MTALWIYLILDAFFTLWALPVLLLWCIKPGKGVVEGFADWLNDY